MKARIWRQLETNWKLSDFWTLSRPTCKALKITRGVRGERVALLSRSCSSLSCRPRKSVGGLRVCVPQYCIELKASGKRESFLKRSTSSRSTDSDDLSKRDGQDTIKCKQNILYAITLAFVYIIFQILCFSVRTVKSGKDVPEILKSICMLSHKQWLVSILYNTNYIYYKYSSSSLKLAEV